MVRDDRAAVAACGFGMRVMVRCGLGREWRGAGGEDGRDESDTGGCADGSTLHGFPLRYRCNKHVYRVTSMLRTGKSETVSIASECNWSLLVQNGKMHSINTQYCLFDATFGAMLQKVSL
jgi:hypothetical protein